MKDNITLDEAAKSWKQEITDYLIGRIGKIQTEINPELTDKIAYPPISRWWIFAGKRYSSIEGTLETRWAECMRYIQLLKRTFNPKLRVSGRLDGDIDWGAMLSSGLVSVPTEYIVRSSQIGVSEREYNALLGWQRWISEEWRTFCGISDFADGLNWVDEVLHESIKHETPKPTMEQLINWAHIARRSRWPILRNVVSESLRVILEPEALIDQIPLPSSRDKLFELLCLVRIARRLAPIPADITWIDRDLNRNTIVFEGVLCRYQKSLSRSLVLSSPDYPTNLASAVDVFSIGIPEYVDLAFEFDPPRNGFYGLIIEAKSGDQTYSSTVSQLRSYRYAYSRPKEGRYLIWGVVERSGEPSKEQIDWLNFAIKNTSEDIWVFSSADAIDIIINVLGIGNNIYNHAI